MELMLLKTAGCSLVPADVQAQESINRLTTGQGVSAVIRRARNILFHRKMFCLFKLAFDAWSDTPDAGDMDYKGMKVERDFDRFRRDMTILAGFYRPVYNVRGDVRLEAESLSFAAMSTERFGEVYHGVLRVVWKNVLHSARYKSPEDVDRVVNALLEFD